MTKQELHVAQFLWSTWESAQEWADRIDPNREGKGELTPELDRLSTAARAAFMKLTGHHPQECKSLVQINTVTPAEPWKSLKPRQRIK